MAAVPHIAFSGRAIGLLGEADHLAQLIALARVRVEVRQRSELGRKADTAVTRADPRKLRHATGWTPRIPLDQTLADILDDWRKTKG